MAGTAISVKVAKSCEVAKLKVFVSYARRDLDFADRLVAALEARGIEVLIDSGQVDRPCLAWQHHAYR